MIGCGGVGLQIVAGGRARRRGRGSSPSTPTRRSSRWRAARGATDAVDAQAGDAAAAVLALVPGGVDHAFEAVGRPETIRQAWDVLRPGATAIVVGIAPLGVEVSLPALELLSEKGLRGSLLRLRPPGARRSARSPALVAAGELPLADVVSHVTDLEGIEDGLARLRAGEGARTVAIMDAAAAGRD